MSKISGIYLIINTVNGKIYVGSAADIISRWNHHKRFLELGRHHSILLQRAYEKYGADNLHFCIVEECSVDKLFEIEQIWIDNCNPAYNVYKIAGSPRGRKLSEEHKAKIGEWSRNRVVSEETKQRMSEYHKNRNFEHRANHSAAMKQRVFSNEHKRKLSEANQRRGKLGPRK